MTDVLELLPKMDAPIVLLPSEARQLREVLTISRNREERTHALLYDLLEWALDACSQGAGRPFKSAPDWHAFMSTWEEAETLLPSVADWLDMRIAHGQLEPIT